MTRVGFYLSKARDDSARLVLACRIAEKAWRTGHKVYIHTASTEHSALCDRMLWTFRQGSFIPHALAEQDDGVSPVLIGHAPEPELRLHDVIINLSDEVPVFFGAFERLAEPVAGDDLQRQQARERYRFYRDRGYALQTHELDA